MHGKRPVILNGSGHTSMIRCAYKLTGIDESYAIVGDFHLSRAVFEPIIGDTLAAISGG